MGPRSRRRVLPALLLLTLSACSAADVAVPASTTAVAPTSASPVRTSGNTDDDVVTGTGSAAAEPTPLPQPGMVTGPGVDDVSVTLGALVDPAADRGFLVGLRLWRDSVNGVGGICGRAVLLAAAGENDVPTDLPAAYRELGTSVLGFVTLTGDADDSDELGAMLSADRTPAVTTSGTADDLRRFSPVVLGPTEDLLLINALDQLTVDGTLQAGDTVAMVSDGSPAARNAAEGLRWYAARTGLDVLVQTASGRDPEALADTSLVVALGTPELTAILAAALPTAIPVLTTLDGYDPALLDPAAATHVDIALGTPVPGSTHPGAVAVEAALEQTGELLGARTFAGYAAGAGWGRLLQTACDNGTLTRSGVTTAMATVGPASVDSLLADADPGRPLTEQLPASTSSSLAAADPSAATGLRPLTGLVTADTVEDYLSRPR